MQQKSSLTFHEWHEKFLEVYKSNLATRTIESYCYRYKKHLYPFFKNKRLNNIQHLDYQKFFNHLNGYSQNYIHKLYHDLDQMFDKAIVNGYMNSNPVKGCILPSGHFSTRRAITSEERAAVLSVCKYHESGLYILFMLYCGLRPHETAYVQGKDVEGDVLHVRGTKSICSDRYAPVPKVLLDMLPAIRPEGYFIKSLRGIAPTKESHRAKLWNHFKKELKKYIDVADDLVPYYFRQIRRKLPHP